MKLNHMVCPYCEHDFFTTDSYATCDSCYRFFYASESMTNKRRIGIIPRPSNGPPCPYTTPTIIPGPTIVPTYGAPTLSPWGEWGRHTTGPIWPGFLQPSTSGECRV